jgi:DNA-binding transcriptional MerR regulator
LFRAKLTQRLAYVNVNFVNFCDIFRPPERGESEVIMQNDQKTIREMCDLFDVTPRTLRFYEAKELIAPIRDGQKRLYTKRDRARLKLILRGKKFGFSLEEIRQLLEMYYMQDQQQTQMSKTYELAQVRLQELKRQRDELDQTIEELEEQLRWGADLIKGMNISAKATE